MVGGLSCDPKRIWQHQAVEQHPFEVNDKENGLPCAHIATLDRYVSLFMAGLRAMRLTCVVGLNATSRIEETCKMWQHDLVSRSGVM